MSHSNRLQHARPGRHGSPHHARGLSLIELMIAMLLGLLVVGGAIGIFSSSRQTYRATESLGRMQESARVAFELMAREVREAGGNPCGNNLGVANVLSGSAGSWWTNWGKGVVGYDGGASAEALTGISAPGTDAIQLMSATSGGVGVVSHNSNSAQFKVNTNDHGLEDFDIVMVCDYGQASIFQITNTNASNMTIVHNTGSVGSGPGNCSKKLGLPVPPGCVDGGPEPAPYTYGANSIITKLQATRWYVADNGRGGRSLYRARMDKGVMRDPQEIVENIQDMEIQYLVEGASDYVDAAAVPSWSRVTAVSIELDVQGTERVGTDGQPLVRQLAHVVTLRNRVP